MAKKKKYYVVWHGVTPGIYDSWNACQAQIKGFPGAKYKSYTSRQEAESAYQSGPEFSSAKSKTKATVPLDFEKDIVWESISVDAACSGNPGVMEYQGVDTKTKVQIFHKKFPLGTNNIGEFLALVHGIALLKQEGRPKHPIYTDSKIAKGWVHAKKCRTKLVRNAKTAELYRIIGRAEKWLQNNSFENPILKWETKIWGEIPADFGRK